MVFVIIGFVLAVTSAFILGWAGGYNRGWNNAAHVYEPEDLSTVRTLGEVPYRYDEAVYNFLREDLYVLQPGDPFPEVGTIPLNLHQNDPEA